MLVNVGHMFRFLHNHQDRPLRWSKANENIPVVVGGTQVNLKKFTHFFKELKNTKVKEVNIEVNSFLVIVTQSGNDKNNFKYKFKARSI